MQQGARSEAGVLLGEDKGGVREALGRDSASEFSDFAVNIGLKRCVEKVQR